MFSLKIIQPTTLNGLEIEDEFINEAIESVYSIGDDLIMEWDQYPIRLSMKYDIGDIWNDIIHMLNLIDMKTSVFTINWPSNSFFAQWNFILNEDTIMIESFWTSIHGGKRTLNEINKRKGVIMVPKRTFIFHWYRLLIYVFEDIKKVKDVDLNDWDILEDMLTKLNPARSQ